MEAEDAEALARLHVAYADRLLGWLMRRVGSRETAEDLVTETFIKAARSVGGFEDQGDDGRGWIFTIAHHVLIDYYRSREYNQRPEAIDTVTEPLVAPADRYGDLDVQAAIERLSAKQARAITLHYLEGRGVIETGEIMGVHESAIVKLLMRARANLKEILGEQPAAEEEEAEVFDPPGAGMDEMVERAIRAQQITQRRTRASASRGAFL